MESRPSRRSTWTRALPVGDWTERSSPSQDAVVGCLHVEQSSFGYGEIGMMVARDWRGQGVGSALVAAAIEWGREHRLHKLTLSVFPHNEAAIALYRRFNFEEEGYRPKQMRRSDGELWDLIEMGLLL
jgi:RimJ/RimL family protein N-acetyltransferase